MANMTNYTWQSLSQQDRAEFWATLALKYSPGIGPRLSARVLRHFGSAYTAIQQLSDWEDIGIGPDKTVNISSGAWRDEALIEWRAAQSSDAHILMWHHQEYPDLLQAIIDAPTMFYALGNLSLLAGPCIAIVGSRKCTAEGVEVAGKITRDLAGAGITIVSGMAQGIDRVAHVASLHKVGKSVAVLGTGIDVVYPKSNRDIYDDLIAQGLVISEFAPKTSPIATNFPIRNRIISGLSIGVLVVEGSLRSGTLITARQALEQNRDVFAIPGPATSTASQGCQELIRQGAKVVFTAEDILCDLAEQLKPYVTINPLKAKNYAQAAQDAQDILSNDHNQDVENNVLQSFTSEEQVCIKSILKYLHGNGESHVDAICLALEKPIHEVTTMLMSMELSGLVKRLPGAHYSALVAFA